MDNKMRFIDYVWAGVLFFLAMLAASCSSNQLVECDIKDIELYANERCQNFLVKEETCKEEVKGFIKQTCGI